MLEKIGIISLGCAKNLVDTELMLGLLIKAGYDVSLDVTNCDIVIVNTCAFIHDAKRESVKEILRLVALNKKVIVAGCLSQGYYKELQAQIPEIFAYLGSSKYDKIVEAIECVKNGEKFVCVDEKPKYHYVEDVCRAQITLGASSYIKIADGCNFECGYCIIPKLKGKYQSRKIEDIVCEARKMAQNGVCEIILIAQDTTNYGIDIYKKPSLARLLTELNKIENLDWIRVLYAYPTNFNDELIEAYQKLDKVVKYIDIPLQHYDLDVLRAMKRPAIDYSKLIKKIRQKIKNVAIRTTFIVGYPTETQAQFENLYNFVRETKFDRLGVFEFSKEEGTYASSLSGQVPSKIKRERKNKILALQKEISLENNKKMIGKKIKVIVEQVSDCGIITSRTYKDAPDVDALCYIKTNKALLPSDIVEVKITGCDEYDLTAEF